MQALTVQRSWSISQKLMANIDLITGFLGAGKTTFIRKYADFLRVKGESFAVVENEYGSKGIDARILSADGIDTEELYGGCICCTLKVGFHDMLLSFADKVDRVIVEPSGVYDISQFYSVMSSPELVGKCNIGNVICIVDPLRLDCLDDFSLDMLKRQVLSSGAVVFSMVGDEADIYRERLSNLLGADINAIRYSDMETIYRAGGGDSSFAAESTHSATYLSTTVKPEPTPDIKNRIAKLFRNGHVGEVLRVKGFWNGYLVNAVDGNTEIYKCDGPEGLNVIGIGLRRKNILEVLNNGTERKED